MKKERIETLTIAILINNIEETIFSQIIEIAKSVKSLKIVTNRISKFNYIEEMLYNEYGIALQVTNNKEKAIANVEIIINFDFKETQINEYKYLESATIVNIKNVVKIDNTKFSGNILNYYKITCSEEILELFCKRPEFNINVLYEGLIYRRDSFMNIRKQLEADGVKLLELTN